MTSPYIFGFQATRLGLILFILCLLYVGELQSISEANNSGLQTQQYPTGQVAGNPCRRRFNTEGTATWTSTRAAKKKTSAFIERPVKSPRVNKHGNKAKWFWITRLSYFSSRFKQCEWQRKIPSTLLILRYSVQPSHGPGVWSLTFRAGGRWGAGSNTGEATSSLLLLLLFVCFVFFSFIVFVSVYSHCWPFLAWRDFLR